MKISRVATDRCLLGEGPLWDVKEETLYFTDHINKRLLRYHEESGETCRWEMPGEIGSFALRERGGGIIAIDDCIYAFDVEFGKLTPLAKPQPFDSKTRFNDGKVDRRGRFFVGTLDKGLSEDNSRGELYRLDVDGSLQLLDTGFCCGNGPCWSPDDRTFYLADTLRKTIYAYDYDIDTGSVNNRRPFANTEALGGVPDGATTDRDGLLWTALPYGGKVACYRPDGKLERTIEMPVPWPSSVMFGGADLDRLFVTSIDPAIVNAPTQEGSGCLFVIDGLGVSGLAEHRYCG